MKLIFALLFLALLTGCASNSFSKFYTDHTASTPKEVLAAVLLPYSGKTQVFSTSDHLRDADALERQGYRILGESNFEGGGRVTEAQLVEHGKAVGADRILYASAYQGSHQSSMPIMQFNPGTTSTTQTSGTVNANAYGTRGAAYGTATYAGTSTTTTPGTYSTSHIPITVHRYSHTASYWRKAKPPILGTRSEPLPDELRQRLQRNGGALVRIVGDDTPAFKANVLVGDVIIALDDTPVTSPQTLSDALGVNAGKEVTLTIIRGTETLKISTRLNPDR